MTVLWEEGNEAGPHKICGEDSKGKWNDSIKDNKNDEVIDTKGLKILLEIGMEGVREENANSCNCSYAVHLVPKTLYVFLYFRLKQKAVSKSQH